MGCNPSKTQAVSPSSNHQNGGKRPSIAKIKPEIANKKPEVEEEEDDEEEEEEEEEEDPKYASIMNSEEVTLSKFKNITKQKSGEKLYTQELADTIDALSDYFTNAPEDDYVLRKQIATKIVTSGVVRDVLDIFHKLTSSKDFKSLIEGDSTAGKILHGIIYLLVDFTDSAQKYSHLIVNHSAFLKDIANILNKTRGTTKKINNKDLDADEDEDDSDDEEEHQLDEAQNSLMTIIHNVAMVDENVSKLKALRYVEIVTKYLDHPNKEVRFIAIASLADIVNEEESAILQKGQDNFKFLVKVMKLAMKASDRHHLGWPAWELARTTRKIAVNDTNKRALVEHGCLPLLVQLAHSNVDVREKREAISALRTLSFDKENQKTMVTDKNLGVIDVFTSYRNSPDKEVSKACVGALWNLREELAKVGKYKDLVKEITGEEDKPASRERNQNIGHVMISYQWANQNIVIQVRDRLRKAGCKVWVDIDDMAGSTLQAMASAIENAEIVLVCFSKRYKESDNCRAEAEYAFEKRKKIVPLRMDHGYKPDGWLGIIIGAKLYHDFGGKYSLESRYDGLVKEVQTKYNAGPSAIVPQKSSDVYSQPVVTHSEAVYSAESDVINWSRDDVKKWLRKHGLDSGKFGHLDGKTISYLQYLYRQSPDFYNSALKEHMKIQDLPTMAAFTFALDHT